MLALGMTTSAAPSNINTDIISTTNQTCPQDNWYLCVGPRRSACLGSGLDICKDTNCGGPCYECDKFCKGRAEQECRDLGCVEPTID